MRVKFAPLGGVNSKYLAVRGIIVIARVAIIAEPESQSIIGAGHPAFSIGNIERIENNNNISVTTLAMNQFV